MTESPSAYLPFADIDEEESIKWIQEAIDRLLSNAYESKLIDEATYRRLSAAVTDIEGDAYDYFLRMMDEFTDAEESVLLERIMKGAEFIDSLSPEDSRKEGAQKKYDKLSNDFRNNRDWRDDFARRYGFGDTHRSDVG